MTRRMKLYRKRINEPYEVLHRGAARRFAKKADRGWKGWKSRTIQRLKPSDAQHLHNGRKP